MEKRHPFCKKDVTASRCIVAYVVLLLMVVFADISGPIAANGATTEGIIKDPRKEFSMVGEFGSAAQANELLQASSTELNASTGTVDYDLLWDDVYPATLGRMEFANDVAVDKSGNVYVTGYGDGSMLTIKYDPAGTILWTRSLPLAQGASIAVDKEGYIHVAGYHNKPDSFGGSHYDFYTVKYDSFGTLLWAKTYNTGSGYGNDDYAQGVAVDGSGNIYVTGYSGDESTNDYLTLKYDAAGNLLWTKVYNGGGNDKSDGIAVDSQGDIYVTGNSVVNGSIDYLTVKYDSYGNIIWTRSYNGGGDDYADGIAVDGSGNIFVTGMAYYELDAASRCVTLKYDAQGNQTWVRAVPNSHYCYDVALDESGNAYVSGRHYGVSYDIFVSIYNSDGDVLGYESYASPAGESAYAIAVDDDAANIYVAGYSAIDFVAHDYSFLTIKYANAAFHIATAPLLPDGLVNSSYSLALAASKGTAPFSWVINGGALPPGLSLDAVSGIISGTPTTTGTYTFTVQATDSALLTATKTFKIFVYLPLAVVTKSLPNGALTLQYNQSIEKIGGKAPHIWSVTTGVLPAGLTLASATGAISGTPTTIGTSNFTIQVKDANYATAAQPFSLTIEYPPVEITTAELAKAVQGVTYSQTVAAKGGKLPYTWSITSGVLPDGLALNNTTGTISGIPLVRGAFTFTTRVEDAEGKISSREFSITSYDTISRIYNSGINESATGITMDKDGNLYVTGYKSAALGYDYLTIKYDQSRNVLWTRTYEPGDVPYGIAVDGTGDIYVTGRSHNGTNYDFHTIKYDPTGNVQWAKTYDGGQQDFAYGIAVDKSGNIYVTGETLVGESYTSITIKYDPSGNLVWTKTFGRTGQSITTDATGNIYVTGFPTLTQDFLTVKYDSAGNIIWNKTYDSGKTDYSYGVAVDGNGNVYVTGESHNGTNYDFSTIKYDPSGNLVWTKTFDSGQTDSAKGIAVDGIGNIYVTGQTYDGYNYDSVTLKYDPSGNVVWTKAYDGGKQAITRSIFVDEGGTAYVAGSSFDSGTSDFLTIKYDNGQDITPSLLPAGRVGTIYNQTVSATSGSLPYTWSIVNGSLPPGLTFGTLTGLISGTPTAAGKFNFSIQVTDSSFFLYQQSFSIEVQNQLTITTSSLPSGTAATPYGQTLTASGGKAPYAWSIISGSLPLGLSLGSTTGTIAGIPSAVGTYNITAQVTDSLNFAAAQPLSIAVNCSQPVRIKSPTHTYFNLLQAAYSAAQNSDSIELQAMPIIEDVVFDRPVLISLKGGFDCGYADSGSFTTVFGSFTVSQGTLTLENFILQ